MVYPERVDGGLPGYAVHGDIDSAASSDRFDRRGETRVPCKGEGRPLLALHGSGIDRSSVAYLRFIEYDGVAAGYYRGICPVLFGKGEHFAYVVIAHIVFPAVNDRLGVIVVDVLRYPLQRVQVHQVISLYILAVDIPVSRVYVSVAVHVHAGYDLFTVDRGRIYLPYDVVDIPDAVRQVVDIFQFLLKLSHHGFGIRLVEQAVGVKVKLEESLVYLGEGRDIARVDLRVPVGLDGHV